MKNIKAIDILKISSFILLEVLALVSFGLSGSIVVYSVVGLASCILILIVCKKEIRNKGFSSLLFFLLPLIIFALINFLSPFAYGAFKDDNSILISFFILLAFLTFSIIGYLSSTIKEFNISIAISVIYGGLALLVLICYLLTMIEYVPFYTVIYKNYYIFYDGSKSQEAIGNMAYFLAGFRFEHVSISYFSFFPALLSSSALGLFFISPKNETKKFILYCVYALIGIIPLITMPSKQTLASLILILISDTFIVLIGKKYIKSHVISILFKIIIPIASVILLIMIINASSSISAFDGFRNAIASNSLLNKIFNANPLVKKYNDILQYTFADGTYFGFFPIAEYTSDLFVNSSSSVLIDTVMTSGIVGLIIFIWVVAKGLTTLFKYYKESDDPIVIKTLIIGFILTFIFYSGLSYDMTPYIYYADFLPIFTNGLFLILLFFVGYAHKVKDMKKVEDAVNE